MSWRRGLDPLRALAHKGPDRPRCGRISVGQGMQNTMGQGGLAIRGWLVAAACAIVLGLGAVFVLRAVVANEDAVAPDASDAMPKHDAPAATTATPAAAPAAASITAEAEAEAEAREASWREAREASIRVQQRLRAEQQARKAAQQEEAKNERCVDGQRMKRVENGWVQAGNC